MLKLREKNLISDEHRERALDTCCAGVSLRRPYSTKRMLPQTLLSTGKIPEEITFFLLASQKYDRQKINFAE
ncbi:hypothetical protein [Massilia sp. KIM]|uniref:hypothetical protein n=1 Tax=Massilia sp. KIM TaxID=1955422 RepID=UPI00117EF796|nr:hypothetical protein [Massilia sp. KIM]